jgi:hypothetical protein
MRTSAPPGAMSDPLLPLATPAVARQVRVAN